MDIRVTTGHGQLPVTVIYVNGDVDSTTSQDFLVKIEELIFDGARHILIDLSNVPFISSAGLRAIHNIFNQLRALHKDADDDALRAVNDGTYKSPNVKLLNLSEQTNFAFETAGFDVYIETFTDRDTAINSF